MGNKKFKIWLVLFLFLLVYSSIITYNSLLRIDSYIQTEQKIMKSSGLWDYTGVSYYIADQDIYPEGFYWDGEYWWMIGSDNDTVYQYESDWSYTGNSYSISGQCTTPTDLFWDGSHWWVLGDGVFDSVYQYYPNWTYTGNSYSVKSQEPAPKGICWDGTNWWVVGLNDRTIYKYTSGWIYTGTSHYIGDQDGYPSDLYWDGNNWWVPGINNDNIYKYYDNWTYTGTSYYLGTLDTYPTDIFWNSFWFMLGYENSRVYQYYGDAPLINVNAPEPYELFGINTPGFDVNISDPDGIDAQWYTVGEAISCYRFLESSGTINQTAWSGQGNGTVSITFYANDTKGNIAYSEIIVRKDIIGPMISIISPEMNAQLKIAPAYEINVSDDKLDKIWYSLDRGVTKSFITSPIGVIDESLWNQLPKGYVDIRFYANDTLGNISYDEVIVYKEESPVDSIPGYNLFIFLGIISIVAVIFLKKFISNRIDISNLAKV